jgi:anti-sigma factor RsiW
MSSDEARDLFSEAFEGELEPPRRAAFEAALAADPELAQEFEDFVETFRAVGSLGEHAESPTPDLLAGVQDRLRRRSGGRYYRDAFARGGGPSPALSVLLAVACLVMLGLAWYSLSSTEILDGSSGAHATPTQTERPTPAGEPSP